MFNSINTLKALLVLLLSAVLLTALPATAQKTTAQAITLTTNIDQNEEDDWDDDWQEVEQSPYQILGFIEAAKGQFTQNNRVNNASSMSEFRARIEFNYSHDLFEITAKGDASYDDVLDENQWQTREVNLSASPLDILDVKIGRQILTWGTGDYLFLNDLFAKDWQSFFAGRDDEYLKAPSDSIKTSWYFEKFSFDLAWTPEFTPDNYLTGERFVFYSSESQSIIAPANKFKVEQTKNAQWATRIATNHNSVEYALYGYKGYWTTPQGINSNNTSYFPKLNSWGASVRMPLGKGLFNSEYVYYQSAENKKGKSRNIAHSQSRFLIGYEQELMKHLTFSFQYYVEKTHDYKKLTSQQTTAPIIDEYRQLLTTRFTYSAMQQKLIYSLFSFYSPTDQDAYIRPSVQFRQNDQWSFAIGANLFKGKNNYSFFGQHQDNSNAWARIRFQY